MLCQNTERGVPCDRTAAWIVRGPVVRWHICCDVCRTRMQTWQLIDYARPITEINTTKELTASHGTEASGQYTPEGLRRRLTDMAQTSGDLGDQVHLLGMALRESANRASDDRLRSVIYNLCNNWIVILQALRRKL